MIDRDRKKTRWSVAMAVVMALLACGLAISLAVRKVEVEKKVERKFAPHGVVAKPTPKFPPLEPQADH